MEILIGIILFISCGFLLYSISYLKRKIRISNEKYKEALDKKGTLIEEYSAQDKDLKNQIDVLNSDIENLRKAIEERDDLIKVMHESLDKKTQLNKETMAYLDQFFNNGIFYDQENDTMVLISNLIRVEDFETKEVVNDSPEAKDEEL
jgi:hypothetical protein